ncbi:hypothetical protein J2Z69_002763 [Paenibacillus shirakamiensis]|uniref:Uncharacterized protein n=1 Tax=Paenibacillus shirakamiensis TaxID=1265935 RepID=A0ABS4JJ37_9BACL|nr:hypothetical protein [Paenibacillus shirakamiensis]MBP2001718.1 hypothetical protein [Paenibacillus shirakamiensis]
MTHSISNWFSRIMLTTIMFMLATGQTSAAASVGQVISRPDTAVTLSQADNSQDTITFKKGGTSVFVSNAPETLWDGNRTDGSKVSQVNATLYRDKLTGSFRFWSVHTNATKKKLNFYMNVQNPSSQPVKLYMKKQGYSYGTSADPASSAVGSVQQFLGKPSTGSYIATIPPGGSYFICYAYAVAPYQALNYIGDFRAVNVKTGQNEAVNVSDIATNNGTVNLKTYAASPRIAPTNYDFKTGDDYRGLLPSSARTVEVNVELTPDNPAKSIKISDSEPFAYTGEQERLMTRWTTAGIPLAKAVEVVGNNKKQRGAYWYTDLSYAIHIENNTGLNTVRTLYGSAPRSEATGFIHYKLDQSPLQTFAFGRAQTRFITSQPTFTLNTMIQPFLSVPLGLYFVAE